MSEEQKTSAITSVNLVIMKHDKHELVIATLLRHNSGPYYDGLLDLCHGYIQDNETLLMTLVRIAKRDFDLDIDPNKALFQHVMHRQRHDDTGNKVDFFFMIDDLEKKLKNENPSKAKKIVWIPVGLLPLNLVPHIRYALDCINEGREHSSLTLKDIQDLCEKVQKP